MEFLDVVLEGWMQFVFLIDELPYTVTYLWHVDVIF